MRKLQWLLAAAILLALPSAALAQRSTATVRGTARDTTQAVLPGVTITVTNQDTGLVREVTTNADGVYFAPELPIGRYTIEAQLQGFKRASRTGILLRVADEFAVDFELSAGDVAETINVEASSTPVKVLGGDVSGVITGEQVRELPLNGRNFLQLATLMPGVSAPDMLNVKDKGLLGGSDLSVSGSDVTANLWTVDGANNNDVGSNRTILVYPSLEAIQEFKILRNSYGPEFGGAGGAQINIVTRGGTNRFEPAVLLGTERRAEREELLSGAGGSAERRTETERLRRVDRRTDHQEQVPFLRERRVERRGPRNRPGRLRAHPSRAQRRFQRSGDPRLRSPHLRSIRSPGRRFRTIAFPGPHQPCRPGVPQPVSAPQRHAGGGQLQQLGDLGDVADRLPPVQRPR